MADLSHTMIHAFYLILQSFADQIIQMQGVMHARSTLCLIIIHKLCDVLRAAEEQNSISGQVVILRASYTIITSKTMK